MHDQIDLFRPKLPTTFGSASWASLTDLRRAEMLDMGSGKNLGPVIGCLTPAEIGGRDLRDVFVPGEGHLLTAAPTRSGKGQGQIITNLLWWPGSAVVIDVKGENWDRTAGWRHSEGHKVVRFAPFEVGTATWNPIDQINDGCGSEPNSPKRQENARYLANLMITPNPHAKDPYWDNASKTLLQGLMMHVATAPIIASDEGGGERRHQVRSRTMREVRRLITLDPKGFASLLKDMIASEEDWVRETAGTMLQMEGAREQSASVKTILMEHTTIWAYRRIQEATSSSSFSFRELRDDPSMTIYFVVPPEALTEYRALLRVLVGSCMKELRESWNEREHSSKPPVLFFLDEFPQLAYMQPIEEALLYIASYGVKFWFFVQDISQLQQHYEKTWRQFIANCSARTFFGVSDIETAKVVSEMSGTATTINRSYQAGINESESESESSSSGSSQQSGDSESRQRGFFFEYGPTTVSRNTGTSYFDSRSFTTGRSWGSNYGTNVAYVGRPLFMPDEVLRMPFGSMIALVKGMPAIKGQLRFWFESKDLFEPRGRIRPP